MVAKKKKNKNRKFKPKKVLSKKKNGRNLKSAGGVVSDLKKNKEFVLIKSDTVEEKKDKILNDLEIEKIDQDKRIIPLGKVLHPILPKQDDFLVEKKTIWTGFKILFRILKVSLITFVFVIFFIGVAAGTIYWIYGRELPDVRKLKKINFAETSTIYDREGNILYKIFRDENREFLPLEEIDSKIVKATIAIEDKNFYNHFGFDPVGIIRAQLRNLDEDGKVQGASTITQQLAKNLFLSPEKTVERKIKELILALQIEWYFEKKDILEMYLNKIPYGSNSFGVEAAAQTFFDKSAREVELIEAVVLAALPNGPSKYSPYGANKNLLMGECVSQVGEDELKEEIEKMNEVETNEQNEEFMINQSRKIVCESPFDKNYIWGRKDQVLKRMLEEGFIDEKEFLAAWKAGFDLKFRDLKHAIKEPHFVFYVKDYLEKKYGKDLVESGGLEIRTTLDPKLQKLGQDVINEYGQVNLKKYGANNGAMVAIDPRTNHILAMVGSKNYWDEGIDGQVNVATSFRQPGSSFKPLIYAAAIENGGIGSGTFLNDYKTRFGNEKTVPKNFDGKYLGKMTIRKALGGSRNIPAIKAFYVAGEEEKVLDFLDKLGFTNLKEYKENFNKYIQESPLWTTKWTFNYGWPLAIGSGEVRLLDLVNAYAVMANAGKYLPPNPILEVRDRFGNVLEKFDENSPKIQVMSPETAFIVSDMLADPMARPAGVWRNILTIPGQVVAAKTGTSDKKIGKLSLPNNTLTIGYSKSLAVGFWFGNTNGAPMRNSAYSLYTTDPPWNKFMVEALKDKPREEFYAPGQLIKQGNEYFPSFWKKENYDKWFKRLDAGTKDCNDEERKLDPEGCKPKEVTPPPQSQDRNSQGNQSMVGVPELPLADMKKQNQQN